MEVHESVWKSLGVDVKIAGVVLAGGQSLRMGRDKATLTIEQQTLLERSVDLLHRVGFDDCFVSGQYEGFDCIADQQTDLGPIAGIAACAKQLYRDYDAVFIIPVDMPLLAEQDCRYLLQYFLTLNTTNTELSLSQGVYYQKTTFPMLLTLNQALLDYLADVVTTTNKKHRSLYRLLESLDIKGFNQKEEDAFRFENTNTPEQWQHCLTLLRAMQQTT